MRQIETGGCYWPPHRTRSGRTLLTHIHVPDRAAVEEAHDLIAMFGEHAASEAASRADRSRNLGNVVHFCRWRAIERTILMLGDKEVIGLVH
jgi:hypothetical protein